MDALLDLPQLRTFFTLAQTGSFTACARRLNRTQSAVSHAMAKLEDRFSIYQKKVKAGQERQKLLTRCLQSLNPAEFGS